MAGFTQKLSETDPHTAAKWAETIADSELRLEQLRVVSGQWLKVDAHAARTWIEGLRLSKEDRQELLHADGKESLPE